MEDTRQHYQVKLDYLVRRATFPGWKIEPRVIHDFELVFIVEGEGDITLGEKSFIGRAGDVICIPPGMVNSFSVEKEPCMVFYGAHFWPVSLRRPPETATRENGESSAEEMLLWSMPPKESENTDDRRLPEAEGLGLPLLFSVSPSRWLEGLFRELYQVHQHKAGCYEWRENLLMEQILLELWEILQQKNTPAQQARIRKVLDHIHENPYRSYSLEELQEIAGIKKSLFLQEFRSVTGTTPIQYVTERRLEYARELLLETEVPIAQIAQQCGFEDVFYFSRCFKKKFHLSPRAYRKEK